MVQYNSATVPDDIDQLISSNTSLAAVHPSETQRHLNIFGDDDRIQYGNYDEYPLCTVGKVRTNSGTCTGTMIGPNLMLTAQHCLECFSDGSIGGMTFTPAYHDGYAPYGSAEATNVYWDHRIPCGVSTMDDGQFAFDYVVVKLDKRIGDQVGWMGYKEYETKWNGGDYWMHIGYGGDVANGEIPLFHDRASIESVTTHVNSAGTRSYIMHHWIDSTNGHSGGPIFGIWEDDTPYIVAVLNGGADNVNVAAGGPGLNALIAYLRSQYD